MHIIQNRLERKYHWRKFIVSYDSYLYWQTGIEGGEGTARGGVQFFTVEWNKYSVTLLIIYSTPAELFISKDFLEKRQLLENYYRQWETEQPSLQWELLSEVNTSVDSAQPNLGYHTVQIICPNFTLFKEKYSDTLRRYWLLLSYGFEPVFATDPATYKISLHSYEFNVNTSRIYKRDIVCWTYAISAAPRW